MAPEALHELRILEQIEANPDSTQADLAAKAGVAVGTVNWYLKRLVAKGFVKVTQMQRRRLRYLITPGGVAEKTKLAYQYVQASMHLYRATRHRVAESIRRLRQAGYDRVCIEGDGDLVDVCRLTCLEHGVPVRSDDDQGTVPRLRVVGTRVSLELPQFDKGHDHG